MRDHRGELLNSQPDGKAIPLIDEPRAGVEGRVEPGSDRIPPSPGLQPAGGRLRPQGLGQGAFGALHLSGGQLQRFLIARALLLDIRLLVADEIISMLDASTRIDVLNLLGDLRERGLSILFITHDLSLGYYISDRSIVLYRGRVVEMGAA
jgi:hypothetical protein